MRRLAVAAAFVVCISAMTSTGRKVQASTSTDSSLKEILQVLDAAKVSGSLQFSGLYESFSYPGFPDLPALQPLATNHAPLLETVRAMFVDSRAMHVTQAPDGTVRMIEAGVPGDILNVKIAHVSFETKVGGVFNPNVAINILMEAPEVKLFMKSNGVKWPFGGDCGQRDCWGTPALATAYLRIDGSRKPVRCIGSRAQNVSGIWTYENCRRSQSRARFVYLQFYELRNLNS